VSVTATQSATTRETDLREVLSQLVHDVRQPLGGIESLAYYFELVLEDCDEELREQCGRLRHLVGQASWMLEDAALAAQAPPGQAPPLGLNEMVTSVGELLAWREERPLRLSLADGLPPVHIESECVRRWLMHVLTYFQDVAQGEPMPVVETELGGEGVWLRVRSAVAREDCIRTLDPPGGTGGLRRLAQIVDGEFHCKVASGVVTVGLWLPAVHDALD
jgi:signal transduction histidine kinase